MKIGSGLGAQVLSEGWAEIRMQSLGLELEKPAAWSLQKCVHAHGDHPDAATLTPCSGITALLV